MEIGKGDSWLPWLQLLVTQSAMHICLCSLVSFGPILLTFPRLLLAACIALAASCPLLSLEITEAATSMTHPVWIMQKKGHCDAITSSGFALSFARSPFAIKAQWSNQCYEVLVK